MADKAISALTAITSPASGDYLPIIDISEALAVNKNKRITLQQIVDFVGALSSTPGGITAYNAGTTYDSADRPIFVTYNGVIYEFVLTVGTATGITPGTNPSVWTRRTVADLAIYRTGDIISDANFLLEVNDGADIKTQLSYVGLYIEDAATTQNAEINRNGVRVAAGATDDYIELAYQSVEFTDYSTGFSITLFFTGTVAGSNKTVTIPDASGEIALYEVFCGQARTSFHASSILDISSTTKGILIPRMTTTQRDAISSPATGLLIYNSTTNAFNYYNGSAWAAVGSGGGTWGSITGTITSQTDLVDYVTTNEDVVIHQNFFSI